MKRYLAMLLCAAILICGALSGCTAAASEKGNLMQGIQPQQTSGEPAAIRAADTAAAADFAVRMLRGAADESGNLLISPVSVLYALAMTANGAEGDTLAQMETVLGRPADEWNAYLKAYMDALPEGKKYKMSIANSIWFKDTPAFKVDEAFLQQNADYYSAGIFQVPFDEETRKQINAWVEKNTDGMIRDILDRIPKEAVMYLINAMAFDAEWETIYKETQIHDGEFTAANGQKQTVKMMFSGESAYLEDGNTTGFLKYYADRKYAFAGLLPQEDMTVQEYIDTLTGEKLTAMLNGAQDTKVNVSMPKFTSGSMLELSELLAVLGMPDAFDPDRADFTGIGTAKDGDIYISRVLHKTFIAVDEKGTKAGAATAVDCAAESCAEEEPKCVALDRPFVYLLIDCETKMPLFIGIMSDPEAEA